MAPATGAATSGCKSSSATGASLSVASVASAGVVWGTVGQVVLGLGHLRHRLGLRRDGTQLRLWRVDPLSSGWSRANGWASAATGGAVLGPAPLSGVPATVPGSGSTGSGCLGAGSAARPQSVEAEARAGRRSPGARRRAARRGWTCEAGVTPSRPRARRGDDRSLPHLVTFDDRKSSPVAAA